MVDSGETDQSHAPDFGARRRGHDQSGRPPRGRNTQEFTHPVQREPHLRKTFQIAFPS